MSSSTDYRARLYAALNVAGVTGLLDTDADGEPALFQGVVIPQSCEGYATINYYQIGPVNCADVAPSARFSVNCRAKTEGEAFTIADAVRVAVNRVSFQDYYMTVSIGQTIPPMDDTDVFNIEVELIFKQR